MATRLLLKQITKRKILDRERNLRTPDIKASSAQPANPIRKKWKVVATKAFLIGCIVQELKGINQKVKILGTDKGFKKKKRA